MSEIDLKGIIELDKVLIEKDKEIERLHSIIKEVREYIENEWNCNFSEICKKQPQKILEILDKENI